MNTVECHLPNNSINRFAMLCAALLSAAILPAGAADGARGPHAPVVPVGPSTREAPRVPGSGSAPARYATPHMHFDARYNHNHYYPSRGYVVGSLPAGYASYSFGGGRYYHHAGVWFRPRGPRFVVAAPPFGLVIPLLPFGYSTIWWRGTPYYYADDVYYVGAPGGYRVVEAPPVDEVVVETQPPTSISGTGPAPSSADTPSAAGDSATTPSPTPSYVKPVPGAPAPDTLIVYPAKGQTATQTSFDRIECDRWAIGQTGYDPSQPSTDPTRRPTFLRAAAACLEGRGYTVK